MYIKWKPPAQANYMLNIDCASDVSFTNQFDLGGVLRNNRGEWVLGFYGTCTATDVLEGETYALVLGLQLAYQNNLFQLEIGIDSMQLIQVLDLYTCSNLTLISDCRFLLDVLDNPQLHQFFREHNRLVRLSTTTSTTTLFQALPRSFSDILYADMNGVLSVRWVKFLNIHPSVYYISPRQNIIMTFTTPVVTGSQQSM